MKYGILVGRFQPIHLAHQAIINEILHDGLIPIIFIGSSNVTDSKNPFSYIERAKMIHEIYGNEVITLPLPDYESDSDWLLHIDMALGHDMSIKYEDCTVYFFRKGSEFDLQSTFQGLKFKKPVYPEVYGLISASDIRENLEGNKQYLDGRIYKYLKERVK